MAVFWQVPHLVLSHKSQALEDVTYFPSTQESQVLSGKQVLQVGLQESIH